MPIGKIWDYLKKGGHLLKMGYNTIDKYSDGALSNHLREMTGNLIADAINGTGKALANKIYGSEKTPAAVKGIIGDVSSYYGYNPDGYTGKGLSRSRVVVPPGEAPKKKNIIQLGRNLNGTYRR